MSEQKKEEGILAGVAKMFRPDPGKPSAPPPSCCGECGGEKKKDINSNTQEKKQ